ncbi:hypothetical protein GOP47_0025533 [Adiantum capillus-veneris]|uniref:NB-ARC domain-containing protein n=1 Tax=Adiantum capillus-veneris TaxID=13818 RepID=A0A9D4Z324_ADICA|nr:hypothetical protein GOP47_0025533 [Adiantum capillus-veneris]
MVSLSCGRSLLESVACSCLQRKLRHGFLKFALATLVCAKMQKTCHVEFGEEQRDQYGLLKIQHQVLKQLTEANQDYSQIHIDHEAKGWTCLKERMPKQQVFLALDNISERNRDVAKDFLYGFEYHVNSIVLVTSRSKDVLEKLGIPERCCMHCPCVTAEEGLKIVLNHVGLNNIEVLRKEQRHIIQKTVEMCNFGGQLHPMALNVLAAQLGMNPSSWKLSALDFSEASDREHKLFTEMEAIVLGLPDQQTRDMFMDIALFTPETVHNVYELCLWLQDTSYITLEHVRKKLNVLRLKSLLEVWSLDCDNICIHDLHRELAKRRTQVGTDALRFIYQTSGEFDPSILEQMERACFVCNSCTKLTLDRCPRLKLLSARSCHSLVEVELQGLTRLVSLELSVCPVETLDLKGLNKLRWLCLTSCERLKKLDASTCEALLCVRVSKCNELEGLEIKNSKLLKSVSVSYNNCLKVVDLGNGNCLRRLAVWFCEKLRDVKMSESVELHEFKKRGCPMLLNLHGCKKIMSQKASCLIVTRWHRISKELITALQASRCLQVLDLWECPMSRLPDLRNCSSLRELKLTEVDVLLDSNDSALLHEYVDILCASNDRIDLPPSLQEVTIRNCRKTVVREICWKLHGLENIVVLLMQTVRVCWDWELYRSSKNPFSDQSWYLNNSEWDVENMADFLHQKIGNIEPEETSDVEQSCSDDECAKETSSVERIALDTSAFVSNRCEKHSDFIKLLSTVLYWIREFLGDKGIQSQVKDIITTGWQKPVQLSLGELYIQDIGGWWGRLLMSDEMRKVHYRSPDYVLLEFFDNFETLQKLFRETAINKATGNLGKTLDKLKMQTVEQLRQQLCVLRALVRGESCSHDCEPWEQRVMDEIILFEYIVTSSDLEQAHEVMWE